VVCDLRLTGFYNIAPLAAAALATICCYVRTYTAPSLRSVQLSRCNRRLWAARSEYRWQSPPVFGVEAQGYWADLR